MKPTGSTIPCPRRTQSQLRRVDHGNCIRPHIPHIQPPAVAAHRQRNRLSPKYVWPGSRASKYPPQPKPPPIQIDRRHRIPVRERDIHRPAVRTKRQRRRMRPWPHRVGRLHQRQLPPNRPLREIKLHHLARIPKPHKSPRPILRKRQRHRVCRRHRIRLRQIEPPLDSPTRRIDHQHIVRKIPRHQQLLLRPRHHNDRRRKRHSHRPIHPADQLRPPVPRQLLQRNRDQPLLRNPPLEKAINNHTASPSSSSRPQPGQTWTPDSHTDATHPPRTQAPNRSVCLASTSVRASGKSTTFPVRVSATASDC